MCRYRARQLRRDRSPTWGASVLLPSSSAAQPTTNELNSIVDSINDYYSSSLSSSASASASVSYVVPEPDPEPEPNFRKQVVGLSLMQTSTISNNSRDAIVNSCSFK